MIFWYANVEINYIHTIFKILKFSLTIFLRDTFSLLSVTRQFMYSIPIYFTLSSEKDVVDLSRSHQEINRFPFIPLLSFCIGHFMNADDFVFMCWQRANAANLLDTFVTISTYAFTGFQYNIIYNIGWKPKTIFHYNFLNLYNRILEFMLIYFHKRSSYFTILHKSILTEVGYFWRIGEKLIISFL